MSADVTAGGPDGVLTRGTLVIDTEACKGCELCIDACPPHVLVMTETISNTRGYRYPELLPGCIACQACTAICPDFVFQVYRYAEPVVVALTTDETEG
jgi:2-oxoglutarate ferredoxin oxidoreductase subunit delta